jgi:hypothetical protein
MVLSHSAQPSSGRAPSLTLRAAVGAAILAWAAPVMATAAELEAPRGTVLLTVEGAIGRANTAGAAAFDREMLESLPQVAYTTSTIWTEGEQVFSGPTLWSILDAAGAGGSQVSALALNDYKVSFPLAEVTETAPIVATRIDGEEFGVRENGPLWIVYPYDSSVEYQTEVVFGRSVWQLVRIEVSD